MARLAVAILLSLVAAVARSRLLEPAAAVSDERDPPKRAAAAEGSEPEPLHRLVGSGVYRWDVGFSLRLSAARGRRSPCPGVHGQCLAAAILEPQDLIKSSKTPEVAGLDPGTDPDRDDEGVVGKGWAKARKVMRKRLSWTSRPYAARSTV